MPLRDDEIGQLTSKNITPLLSPSGVIAYQLCRYLLSPQVEISVACNWRFLFSYGSFSPEMFAETTVQATVVTHGQQGSVQQLRVWVTSMQTGAPVESAEVMLYTYPYVKSLAPSVS